MIPLIQRYVFGELSRTFASVLSAVTVLTVFVGVIQQAMEKGLSIEHTVLILPYIIPSMLPFTIPAALLMTVCLVYGRLSGDHEVTAAKSGGISVMTLLWPALILGGLLSGLSLFLTDQVIPWAETQIEKTIVRAMEDILYEKLRSGNGFRDPKSGLSITVESVEGQELIRPIIVVRTRRKGNNPERTITLRAESASIQLQNRDRSVVVIVRARNIYSSLSDNQSLRDNSEKVFSFPWQAEARSLKARYLAVSEIDAKMKEVNRERIEARDRQFVESAMALTLGQYDTLVSPTLSGQAKLAERTGWYNKLFTEKHSRIALAFSCFFFVLLGGPFAIWQGKKEFLTTFLFCFAPIVGIYYPMIMGMMTQSKLGTIHPMLGMWLANIILGVAAMLVLRRVVRY